MAVCPTVLELDVLTGDVALFGEARQKRRDGVPVGYVGFLHSGSAGAGRSALKYACNGPRRGGASHASLDRNRGRSRSAPSRPTHKWWVDLLPRLARQAVLRPDRVLSVR